MKICIGMVVRSFKFGKWFLENNFKIYFLEFSKQFQTESIILEWDSFYFFLGMQCGVSEVAPMKKLGWSEFRMHYPIIYV